MENEYIYVYGHKLCEKRMDFDQNLDANFPIGNCSIEIERDPE